MAHLMAALGPVQPVLDTVTMFEDILGFPLGLPSLSDIAKEEDPTQIIDQLQDAIATIEGVIEALPI
jgi:hypothetical protein